MPELAELVRRLSPEQRERLRRELAQQGAPGAAPVAILGIGCEVPGASGARALWRMLEAGE
jgi:hypothetical protein